MERFFVLCSASGKPEAIFEVINRAFYGSPDLIGGCLFGSSAQGAGICPQIFFGINVDHSATGGRSTGMLTVADAVVFSVGSVFLPLDFWAAELVAGNAALEFAGISRFHGEGGVLRAAGDAVLVEGNPYFPARTGNSAECKPYGNAGHHRQHPCRKCGRKETPYKVQPNQRRHRLGRCAG